MCRRKEKGREKWGGNQGGVMAKPEGWLTKSLSFRGPITKLDCYHSSGPK